MYRILFIMVTVLAVALGLLIGTLNSETTTVDLLWVQLDWPLGLLLLTALAIGLILGLLLTWLFSVLPMRARLRRLNSASQQNASGPAKTTHA